MNSEEGRPVASSYGPSGKITNLRIHISRLYLVKLNFSIKMNKQINIFHAFLKD